MLILNVWKKNWHTYDKNFLGPKFQRHCCLQKRVLLLYALDCEMPSFGQACNIISDCIEKDSTHERFSVKDPHRNGSMEKNKSCCRQKKKLFQQT